MRINDEHLTWRIIYRTDSDAILILDIFEKKTATTPQTVIATCKKRLQRYLNETR